MPHLLPHVLAVQAPDALDRDQAVRSPEHVHGGGLAEAGAEDRAQQAIVVSRGPFELERPGPSYTADTLRRLHETGYDASQLFFILGTDAFAEIATWRDYPAVLDLGHFVVVARPGQALALTQAHAPELVSRIRLVADGGGENIPGPPCAVFLVNAATPNVSSTDIRERAARGDSLAGLVAPAVERHIVRHRLYDR